MYYNPEKYAEMPLGVVVRRAPGVTKWRPWSYTAVGVLPGAGEAAWKVLRQDGDVTEYHAATVRLQLHGAEGRDFSARSYAPNRGLLTLKFPVHDWDGFLAHLDKNKLTPIVAPQSIALAPYGQVHALIVQAPDGAWLEFFYEGSV